MKKFERKALSVEEINKLAINGIDMSKFHAINKKIAEINSNKKN